MYKQYYNSAESIERLVTFVNEDTNLKIVISIGQVTSEVEQKLKNLGIKVNNTT